MELCDFVRMAMRSPELPFLIIGGYAVAAHGHTRPTFDVDFLARKTDRAEWQRRADEAGLKLAFETQAFAQFEQTDGDGFDIMFVNDATFAQLFENSMEHEFDGARARIPSLDHLLALKIHALKDQPPHRTSKDAEDVEMLARRNQLDLAQPKYERLFLKYGTREIYESLLRILRH